MRKVLLTAFALLLVGNVVKAQDWPNLKRYHEADSLLLASGKHLPGVIYMGDSITDFWISNDSTFFKSNNYVDRGISGQTTGQMLLRFRQDVIELKPKVVVILAGINDIAQNNGPERLDDIYGNIVSMAQLAKVNHIKVVISSVLPAFALPWRPAINPVPQVNTLNAHLKNYAEKNNIVYLDYFSAMADSRSGLPAVLSKDGVHPNLAGYKMMEPLAEKAIHEALERD